MLRKGLAALVLSSFAVSGLTACGSSNAPMTLQQPVLNQGVQTNSFSGVRKEISKMSDAAFKQLDADRNKLIAPSEFSVESAEQFRQFNKLDSNNDGNISQKEFLPGFLEKTTMTLSLQKTANSLFKRLDLSKDNYLTEAELNSSIISTEFSTLFKKYDKEKKGWIFNRGTKGKLSKSEFQNLFAHLAVKDMYDNTTGGGTPAPAPADPAPADPTQPAPVGAASYRY